MATVCGYVSATYQASWDIKAMDTMPAALTADHVWPRPELDKDQ